MIEGWYAACCKALPVPLCTSDMHVSDQSSCHCYYVTSVSLPGSCVCLHGLRKLAFVTAAHAAWQAAAAAKTNTVEPLGKLHVFFTDC